MKQLKNIELSKKYLYLIYFKQDTNLSKKYILFNNSDIAKTDIREPTTI